MKFLHLLVLCSAPLASCAAVATAPAVHPEPSGSTEEHHWLLQLAGEWSVRSEAAMGPDGSPMLMESRERVTTIGDLWICSEMEGKTQGQPFTARMTLGFNAPEGRFVGTWIDSLQSHLWVYSGQLDAARKVLTLEAEGPSFENPEELALYRDELELLDADHRVTRSSVRGADGQWTQFMSATHTRVK